MRLADWLLPHLHLYAPDRGSDSESQTGGHPDIATFGAILGFAVMMVLDVALG